MIERILQVANEYDAIRAVSLHGSRVNPSVEPDRYQDYDIVYYINEEELPDFTTLYGDILIMQQPSPHANNTAIYLMLFENGERLDLTIRSVSLGLQDDSLTQLLLDKDDRFNPVEPSEKGYVSHLPSQEDFDASYNEVWWCLQSVVKGFRRGQFTYASSMLEQPIRSAIFDQLGWIATSYHDEPKNIGMWGKFTGELLPEPFIKLLEPTYREDLAQAVVAVMTLAEKTEAFLAEREGYKRTDYSRVRAYYEKLLNE
ncbi:aminoglycoside 6-adenylyltransferase [Paenalkalicoccus suaedae]|uniref:Aminoglycoside 6-adenylyltransferase n=1 Tax=Paenalkalicoccus suaedae TaxID=2592382 RepID=A0A859FDQ2_9BACI|nr:aminoglycoside 6-adenylyltransferase [Paenalkalicoccus suaedae]QKS71493.1 aminoglycoside 6-adenylyltransferase [Paenalkalicoccus suaedae]